jgi:hypothetical protein
MRRLLAALVLAVVLVAPACSAADATNNVGTIDGPAAQACRDLRALTDARSSGTLSPADARARVEQIYNEAMASSNPILKARAAVLLTDASQIGTGASGARLDPDALAMAGICGGESG